MNGEIFMKHWNTDKLVGAGLVTALFLIILTDTIISLMTGAMPSRELAGNIVSGLIGYIGRNLLDEKKKDGDT